MDEGRDIVSGRKDGKMCCDWAFAARKGCNSLEWRVGFVVEGERREMFGREGRKFIIGCSGKGESIDGVEKWIQFVNN